LCPSCIAPRFLSSNAAALYIAKIIPYRGSWVEFEYDQKKPSVRASRQTQIPGIDLLRALGVWLNFKLQQQNIRELMASWKRR